MYVVPTPTSRAEQATIDARFNPARNYWLLYMSILCACYNFLNNNIDDAFKDFDNPALIGWTPPWNYASYLTR